MRTSSTRPAARTWPPPPPAATSTMRSPASSCALATAASTPSTKWNGASGSQPSGSGRCVTTTTWPTPPGGFPPQPSVMSKTWRPTIVAPIFPVRPGVVVGRLRHLQLAALVQRDVTAGQPVEQRAGLVILVCDEAVHRHRAVHDHLAHRALLCFWGAPN